MAAKIAYMIRNLDFPLRTAMIPDSMYVIELIVDAIRQFGPDTALYRRIFTVRFALIPIGG